MSQANHPLGLISIQAPQDDELKDLLRVQINKQDRIIELLEELSAREEKEFIGQKAAAEYLGISRQTLYDLCSARKIKYHKSGSKNLFRKEELAEYVKEKENRW